MSRAKPWKSKIIKISKFLLIFVLVVSWIFGGWPQIWQKPPFPPEVQKAKAATTYAQGSFTANTSLGNQTVDTGSGVTLKALMLFGTNQTAAGFAAGQSGFIGFAASATQRGVNAWASNDNAATTSAGRGMSNAFVVRLFSNGTPTVDAEADFVDFTTGGAGRFTINWTDAPSTGVIIHYIALGGADITNVFVGQKTAKITSTGNQAETGVGFQGDIVFFSGTPVTTNSNTTAGSGFFGAAQSTTKRGAVWWGARNGRTTTGHSKHWQSTAKALVISNANGVAIDAEADFVSFDTDGYTLNWTDFAGSAWLYNVMVIKGGQYNVGTFTSPALTGVQSYTTGFQPKGVLFFGTGESTADSTLGLEAKMTIGAMGPSLVEDSIWTSADDTINSDSNSRTVTTKVLSANTNPSTIVAEADANAFGATSFSLDWTTTASGRVFFYVAMGAPTVNQNHYRWRNDDNNEASATWGANEDTATSTMYANRVRRLRLEAANTGAGSATGNTYRLEYGTNSDCTTGSWTQVTSVSACAAANFFCMAQSQLTDTSATTNVASGLTDTGSFVAGEQVESDSDTAAITVAASYFTENEYAFKVNTSTPEITTYYFRMSNAGTALNTYGSCAQLTTGAANLNQVHYRWRDDFEAESGTTWQNNLEDTATTSVDISKVMRLRVEVSNKRYASSSQMYILQYSTQATPTNDSWTTIPQTGSCLTAPFCMNASSLTEGGATTNISPGLTDDNTTFVAGLQKESNATTTHISIDTTKYTEIEYAFQVTSNAAGNTAYYFRLATTTAAGAYGQLGTYSVTPQLTTKVTSSGAFDAYASSTISFDASLPVLFASQTSTITKFGAIKIQDDRGTSAGWTLNLAGNDWKTTTGDMQLDYDGTGTDGNLGKLCANPNAGNLYAETGSLTNVNKGALDCFSAGVTVIDVVAASASYGNGTYWLTDMSLGQFFPSNPTAAIYTTTIVFTLQ